MRLITMILRQPTARLQKPARLRALFLISLRPNLCRRSCGAGHSSEPGLQTEPPKEPELAAVLAEAQRDFKDLEVRVLGMSLILKHPLKNNSSVVGKSGVLVDMARNVAERLVLAKLIIDTGNYYLLGTSRLANGCCVGRAGNYQTAEKRHSNGFCTPS